MAVIRTRDKTDQRKFYSCPNGCTPRDFVQKGHVAAEKLFGRLDGLAAVVADDEFVSNEPVVCPQCGAEATLKT